MRNILEYVKPGILSEICRDAAQVFFASAFIEPIVTHSTSFTTFFSGLLFSFGLWSISIYLNNKQKNKYVL